MRKNQWFTGLLFAVICIVLVACTANSQETSSNQSQEDTITVKHKLGETEVTKKPKKVVVFDYGILDSLDHLNIPVTGVPQSSLPKYLSKYEDQQYENVGSLKEPDFEKISELNPDLIIISGRQEQLYEEFTKIGPTIHLGVDTNQYLSSFEANMKTLGTIFDQTEAIEKELVSIQQAIKDLKEKASNRSEKSLVILANDGKVSAYGAKSRFGIIHDDFGLAPADENIKVSTHGQSVSFEYIVEKDPDYLFVIDRGAVVGGESSAKQVVENDLVKKTKAFQNNNIVYLNPDYWYLSGGGLNSVSQMLQEVNKALK